MRDRRIVVLEEGEIALVLRRSEAARVARALDGGAALPELPAELRRAAERRQAVEA